MIREYLQNLTLCEKYSETINKIGDHLRREWIPYQKDALNVPQVAHFTFIKNFFPQLFLKKVALVKWKEIVFETVGQKVRGCILDLIDSTREKKKLEGEYVLVKQFTQFLLQISPLVGANLYKENFETPFIQRLKLYYERVSRDFLSIHTMEEYMDKAEEWIKWEEETMVSFLLESSKPVVVEALNESLISPHTDFLCKNLLRVFGGNKGKQPESFFFLSSRMEECAKTFENHLREILTPLIQKQYNQSEKEQLKSLDDFFLELMRVERTYSEFVKDCFQENRMFKDAMTTSFRESLNTPNPNLDKGSKDEMTGVEKLLSLFAHNLFSGKNKLKWSLEEKQSLLGDIPKLVCYLTCRDIFFKECKHFMCERLISAKCDHDLESLFLDKLEAQFGKRMVKHLRGMLFDAVGEAYENLQQEFAKYLETNKMGRKIEGVKFSARILKQAHCPELTEDKFKLKIHSYPMEKCCTTFEQFYNEFIPDRNIKWLYNKGEVKMNTKFTNKKGQKIVFVVTPLQSQILALFNEQKEWKGADLLKTLFPTENSTKLGKIFFGALSPLVFLPRSPLGTVGSEVSKDSENLKDVCFFLKKSIDCNASHLSFIETLERREKRRDKELLEKRKITLDSAVLRVMLYRYLNRWGRWEEIQKEVTQLVQKEWNPSIVEFNHSLERLLDKELIKRNSDDMNLFQYAA